MPNIKSSAKRDQINKVRYAKNKAERTALRSTLKKFESTIDEGNSAQAKETYKVAVKAVDRAVGKGLIHKNNAARKKSQMARKVNAIAQ